MASESNLNAPKLPAAPPTGSPKRKRRLKLILLPSFLLAIFFAGSLFWLAYDPMPDVAKPVRKLPADNAYPSLLAELSDLDLQPGGPIDAIDPAKRNPASLRKMRSYLDPHKALLFRLRILAESPMEPTLPNSVQWNPRLNANAQAAMWLLCARSSLHLIDKEPDDACAVAFDSWLIADCWSLRGPSTDSILLGTAFKEIARERLAECLRTLPPKDVSRIIEGIQDSFERTPDFAARLRRQREDFISAWLAAMEWGDWLRSSEIPYQSLGRGEQILEDMKRIRVRRRHFMEAGLNYRDRLIAALPERCGHIPVTIPKNDYLLYLAAFGLEPDTVSRLQLQFMLDRAYDAMLMLRCALETYRAKHGSYPASLSDLSPGTLTKLPDDPFSPGAPLRYRKTEKGFVLYSVGPDGIDDGGRAIPAPSTAGMTLVQIGSKGDVVWR